MTTTMMTSRERGINFNSFSALSRRPPRLCGEYTFKYTHRGDAENAEVARRIQSRQDPSRNLGCGINRSLL